MAQACTLVGLVILGVVWSALGSNITLSPQVVSIENGRNGSFTIQLKPTVTLNETAEIDLFTDDNSIAAVPPMILVPVNVSSVIVPVATGSRVGLCHISMNTTSQIGNLTGMFVEVQVVESSVLTILISVVGWIYFCAWSVSFYPQVFLNVRRKSVIGLNFDFLAYNITGFIAYGVFNVGMYWIDPIKNAYKANNPYGVNPVLLNDVIFSLHAIVLTAVTISQCFVYERGKQRVSTIGRVILAAMWLFAVVTLIITAASQGSVITWLEFVYYFSYIKLAVTLIKYVPQAYMNYKRKSTDGWSIGNVLLDFTGGSLSLLQMFLLSYNNDDWGSIFGDPTKFGLGAFSIAFDILFMIQHYCLYRGNEPVGKYPAIDETDPLIADNANDPTKAAFRSSGSSVNNGMVPD